VSNVNRVEGKNKQTIEKAVVKDQWTFTENVPEWRLGSFPKIIRHFLKADSTEKLTIDSFIKNVEIIILGRHFDNDIDIGIFTE